MFEAILSISYGVISNTIYNLIVGNRKYVSKKEIGLLIEESIEMNMEKFRFVFEEKEKYFDNLINEVNLLMKRIEFLSISPKGITLNPQSIKSLNADNIVSNLIQTVENRRKELGFESFEIEPQPQSNTSFKEEIQEEQQQSIRNKSQDRLV